MSRIDDPKLRRAAEALRTAGPATATRPAGELEDFRELERAKRVRDDGEERMRAAVARAREHGMAWRVIAAALGTSHQAAMQRYGKGAGEATAHLTDCPPQGRVAAG